jgi:hypothetical protein
MVSDNIFDDRIFAQTDKDGDAPIFRIWKERLPSASWRGILRTPDFDIYQGGRKTRGSEISENSRTTARRDYIPRYY